MNKARERLLLIDDDPAVLRSCGDILACAGYEVVAADNAAEGLQLQAQQLFDAAIVDIVLPDLNGIEVLRRFKQQDRDIVVILMTGFANLETAIEALRAGAYDYLRKPFTNEDLLRVVRQALRYRAEQAAQRRLLEELHTFNRQLRARADLAAEELAAFVALGERLERASSAAEMLENVLQAVQQLTNATACGIFVRQSNGRLLSVCAIGAKADALQGLDLSTERLMQEVLRTGSPALCHNLLSQPEDAVGPLALAGFQTAIALPLSRLQGVGGVLLVVDGRCEITEKRLPLLTVLAVQAAEIIPAVQAMPNGSALADEFVTLQKLLRNAP